MQAKRDESGEEDVVNIHVDVEGELAHGSYVNLAIGNFNREEFVFDFVFLQPGSTKGQLRSRVILSPRNAKRLMGMLQENMSMYEGKFGVITEDPRPGIQLSVN